jgi:RNA 2',3'-cyclic 3'-phosphodiesterase
MRTFIAIELPEEIKEQIVKIQKNLPEFKGKFTEKENLHLTLKFLGEVDEKILDEIKKRLREIKPKSFESEIKDMGMFSERIVWLSMKNCDELQKKVDDALFGLFEKEKRFMGHLTIARIKGLKDKKNFITKLKKIKISEMKFIVKNFNLKKSTLTEKGPVYEDIEIYNLGI